MTDVQSLLFPLRQALISIGFGEEAADQQLESLGRMTINLLIKRLIKESNSSTQQITHETLEDYIKNNVSPDQLSFYLQEEMAQLLSYYCETITADLPIEKKQHFFTTLNDHGRNSGNS